MTRRVAYPQIGFVEWRRKQLHIFLGNSEALSNREDDSWRRNSSRSPALQPRPPESSSYFGENSSDMHKHKKKAWSKSVFKPRTVIIIKFLAQKNVISQEKKLKDAHDRVRLFGSLDIPQYRYQITLFKMIEGLECGLWLLHSISVAVVWIAVAEIFLIGIMLTLRSIYTALMW